MQLVQIGNASVIDRQPDTVYKAIRERAFNVTTPTAAFLYVENKCHMKCDHCYESEFSHPPEYRISVNEYDRIFDELREMNVLWLTFSGGEVFLRRDFLDIVELAHKKRFSTIVYTSGTLINEAKADRMAELKVGRVEISVYSHDPEVHDRFTKTPRSHERSLNAARLLRERGIPVMFKTCIMTFNVDYLEEYAKMAEDAGVMWKFDPKISPKMDGDLSPLKYAVSPEKMAEVFANPKLQLMNPDRAGEICNGESRFSKSPNGSTCSAATTSLTIGADGGIYPCPAFTLHGGNVKEQSVQDIWYGSELLNDVRKTKNKDLTKCGSCDLKEGCGPCQAYAYIENGDRLDCNTSSKAGAKAKVLWARDIDKQKAF